MRTVIVSQARMTSTRLPGKVLMQVNGKSLLEYQIERLRRVRSAAEVVVATTTNMEDQPIDDLCNKLGVSCFRGSELDVLRRYHEAAAMFEADCIVRVTSDCPLIDPDVVDRVINSFLEQYPACDYVSNTLVRSFPRGMDTEVFSGRALSEACADATDPMEREHVTPFIYRRPERYIIANVCCSRKLDQHRWTVDTMADFSLIKAILEALYPSKPFFNMEDCLKLLIENPELLAINQDVKQKEL